MTICGYCGRENAEAAQTCHECGSALAAELPAPAKPLPWKALRKAGWFGALLFAVVLIYFLSFGPVTRYFTEVTRTQESGETLHVTYRYPNWVYQLYYPAHWLSLTQWGHLTYGKYLRWWERPERAD
jgi:hypothetical protein